MLLLVLILHLGRALCDPSKVLVEYFQIGGSWTAFDQGDFNGDYCLLAGGMDGENETASQELECTGVQPGPCHSTVESDSVQPDGNSGTCQLTVENEYVENDSVQPDEVSGTSQSTVESDCDRPDGHSGTVGELNCDTLGRSNIIDGAQLGGIPGTSSHWSVDYAKLRDQLKPARRSINLEPVYRKLAGDFPPYPVDGATTDDSAIGIDMVSVYGVRYLDDVHSLNVHFTKFNLTLADMIKKLYML